VSEKDWDLVLGTNLKGAFFSSAAVLPAMIEQRSGNIINIASAHGQNIGPPEMTAYVASKAGMISLTKSMAVEYASRGIRINTIVLGAVEGDAAYQVEDQRGREAHGEEYVRTDYDERNHGGLSGRSMAATIAYLVSDEGSYINGSAITVDNGLSAGGYWSWVVAGMRSLGSPRSGVSSSSS
jgi:NAD(P)-dependent dehydrogenase (short-subunit alcohol dehydrogenase family)